MKNCCPGSVSYLTNYFGAVNCIIYLLKILLTLTNEYILKYKNEKKPSPLLSIINVAHYSFN